MYFFMNQLTVCYLILGFIWICNYAVDSTPVNMVLADVELNTSIPLKNLDLAYEDLEVMDPDGNSDEASSELNVDVNPNSETKGNNTTELKMETSNTTTGGISSDVTISSTTEEPGTIDVPSPLSLEAPLSTTPKPVKNETKTEHNSTSTTTKKTPKDKKAKQYGPYVHMYGRDPDFEKPTNKTLAELEAEIGIT